MAIPPGIQREHIFQAMIKIKRTGIPTRRDAREWAAVYEGDQYPCKLLISFGHFYAFGSELDPNPSNFNTYMAQDYLSDLGFQIIEV
jgi:5-methylcytosine-specific restriction protein B